MKMVKAKILQKFRKGLNRIGAKRKFGGGFGDEKKEKKEKFKSPKILEWDI